MLTRQKERFIDYYILSLNATKAAEQSGYSPKTAYSQGSRLLKNVEVKEIVTRRLNEVSEKIQLTDDNIIKSLWFLAQHSKMDSNKVAALAHLARIKGLMKDTPTQSIAIFTQIERELRLTQPIVSTQAIDTQVDTTAPMLT